MSKTIYKDKKGRTWTKETLQNLIDTLESFYEVMDTARYYFRR